MRLTNTLVLAAVGVAAHPSGHLHAHRAFHEQAHDKRTMVTATINGKVVSWSMEGTGQAAATANVKANVDTTAATTTSSAATTGSTGTTSSSTSTSGSSSAYEAFASCANSKRATTADISYVGNTGCSGYGSNFKLIDESIADKYSYHVKAVNDGDESKHCVVWNKIGEDGGINGFFSGNEALSFDLAAGSSQYLAVDSNSQGGMCCAAGSSVPTTTYGQFNCPWLEFDFGSNANDDWSGFDASALVAGTTSGPYHKLTACTADGSTCSTLYEGGGGSNAYLPGDESLDGIGGNLSPGDVSLVATW